MINGFRKHGLQRLGRNVSKGVIYTLPSAYVYAAINLCGLLDYFAFKSLRLVGVLLPTRINKMSRFVTKGTRRTVIELAPRCQPVSNYLIHLETSIFGNPLVRGDKMNLSRLKRIGE
jgi:hypothetical protein